jgi:hypothetical protein
MIETDLKGAMAGLLVGEPRGIDAERALAAGRSARRTRRFTVAASCLVAVAVVATGSPIVFGTFGHRADGAPAATVSPSPSASPSPSLSGMAADLVVGEPLVRADAAHGRAFAIVRIANGSARSIGVAGIAHEDTPGGDTTGLSQRVDATIATEADAGSVTTMAPDQIADFVAGLGDRAQNVVIPPGQAALLIWAVTPGCPAWGAIPAGRVTAWFGDPGVHLRQVPSGASIAPYPILDASSAPPPWLASAWKAACGS